MSIVFGLLLSLVLVRRLSGQSYAPSSYYAQMRSLDFNSFVFSADRPSICSSMVPGDSSAESAAKL